MAGGQKGRKCVRVVCVCACKRGKAGEQRENWSLSLSGTCPNHHHPVCSTTKPPTTKHACPSSSLVCLGLRILVLGLSVSYRVVVELVLFLDRGGGGREGGMEEDGGMEEVFLLLTN